MRNYRNSMKYKIKNEGRIYLLLKFHLFLILVIVLNTPIFAQSDSTNNFIIKKQIENSCLDSPERKLFSGNPIVVNLNSYYWLRNENRLNNVRNNDIRNTNEHFIMLLNNVKLILSQINELNKLLKEENSPELNKIIFSIISDLE